MDDTEAVNTVGFISGNVVDKVDLLLAGLDFDVVKLQSLLLLRLGLADVLAMQVKADEELFLGEEVEDPVFGCAFVFRNRDVDLVGNVDLPNDTRVIRHDSILAHESEQLGEKLKLRLDFLREDRKVILELLLLLLGPLHHFFHGHVFMIFGIGVSWDGA